MSGRGSLEAFLCICLNLSVVVLEKITLLKLVLILFCIHWLDLISILLQWNCSHLATCHMSLCCLSNNLSSISATGQFRFILRLGFWSGKSSQNYRLSMRPQSSYMRAHSTWTISCRPGPKPWQTLSIQGCQVTMWIPTNASMWQMDVLFGMSRDRTVYSRTDSDSRLRLSRDLAIWPKRKAVLATLKTL